MYKFALRKVLPSDEKKIVRKKMSAIFGFETREQQILKQAISLK
jgi:hypothetical protein